VALNTINQTKPTKVVQAAISHLHSVAIQVPSYVDDFLLKEDSPQALDTISIKNPYSQW
jgi:hypothetical protein